MKQDHEVILSDMSIIIDWWVNAEQPDPNQVLKAYRKITGYLFFLEGLRSDFKKEFDEVRFNAIKSGESVSSAQATAEKEVHDLYLLRRAMEAAYQVTHAMSSTVSWAKHERNAINYES